MKGRYDVVRMFVLFGCTQADWLTSALATFDGRITHRGPFSAACIALGSDRSLA